LGVKWGYPLQKGRISGLVEMAVEFGKKTNRPIWLSECGSGAAFGGPMQAVCKAKIDKGKHVILWSADTGRGIAVLYVDGRKVSEFNGALSCI